MDTCMPETIAFLTDQPISVVWDAVKDEWKKKRSMSIGAAEDFFEKFGWKLQERPRKDLQKRIENVGQFESWKAEKRNLKELQALLIKEPHDKRFLIGLEKHVVGWKNGQFFDIANSGARKKVRIVFELEKV